jgi:hypothetical protein
LEQAVSPVFHDIANMPHFSEALGDEVSRLAIVFDK